MENKRGRRSKTVLPPEQDTTLLITLSDPVKGFQVASMAWEIPDELLSRLLLNKDNPVLRADVRSQFALWATSKAQETFSDFAEAWNQFVQPKAGNPNPIVLLPGVGCSRCAKTRTLSYKSGVAARGLCPECKGTGRKAPTLIYAAYAAKPTAEEENPLRIRVRSA